MAVIISVKVKGQTTEGYNSLLSLVRESVLNAPGFILHCAHPADGEWQVTEIWESKAAADTWFVENLAPILPPGIHPKRSYQELHSVVTAS